MMCVACGCLQVQDPGSPTAGPIPLIEHCCDRTDDVGDVLRAVTAPTRVMVVPDVELQGALLGVCMCV